MDTNLESIIKNNKDIPKKYVQLKEVNGDGNCFYRVLARYYTDDQNNHNIFRQIIYESAKVNKEEFKLFFKDDESQIDEVLVNMKYDNYVEEIKRDGFYAGILELGLASIIFKLNISVYVITEQNTNVYKHYTNIWFDINNKTYYNCNTLFK